MGSVKASEVFLEVWQALTVTDPELPAESFARYAAVWRQIAQMEEIQAEAEWRQKTRDMLNAIGARSPLSGRSKSDRAEAVDDPGDPSPAAQDDGLRPVTYDCASAPMPEPEEAKKAAKVEAGKQSLITRKRNALERLDALRSVGVTMAEIAGQHDALTISDVMDAIDRKPLPLPKLAALEAAMGKVETARRGEDDASSAPPQGKKKEG